MDMMLDVISVVPVGPVLHRDPNYLVINIPDIVKRVIPRKAGVGPSLVGGTFGRHVLRCRSRSRFLFSKIRYSAPFRSLTS